MPLATVGLVHPVWAMIAMGASVSLVLLNSFGGRLLPAAKGKGGMVLRYEFSVPNLHCETCVNTIRFALERRWADVNVEADVEKHLVVVSSGEVMSEEEIVILLGEIGFKPS